MQLFFVVFLVLFLLPATAGADSLDDAKSAYEHKDYQTALRLWQPLADQGNAEAQYQLGEIYAHGQGVKIDYRKAMVWYRKAADQDNAAAQMEVARLYIEGWGIMQDTVEGAKWLRKSAQLGDAEAQNNLGMFYFFGPRLGLGAEQSYMKAYFWLSLAVKAKYPQDNPAEFVAMASKYLTLEQRAAIDKQVAEWKPLAHTVAEQPLTP